MFSVLYTVVTVLFLATSPSQLHADSPDDLKAEVLKLADDLARSIRSNQPADFRLCRVSLEDMVSKLQCTTELSVPTAYVQAPPRFLWKSFNISTLMANSSSLLMGSGLLLSFVAPADWKSLIDPTGNLMGYGLGLFFGSFVWKTFLPNPMLHIPVGRNPDAKNIQSSKKNLSLIHIKDVFFERLAQHDLRPLKGVDRDLWLTAITLRLPMDIFSDSAALKREIQLLANRVQSLQTKVDQDGALADVLARVAIELDSGVAFRETMYDRLRPSAWRSKATKKFIELYTTTQLLREQLRVEEVYRSLAKTIKTENQLADKLLHSTYFALFSDSVLSQLLDDFKRDPRNQILINASNARFEVEAHLAEGVPGIIAADATVIIKIGDQSIEKKLPVRFATRDTNLLEAIAIDQGWGLSFARTLKDILSEAAFPTPQQEECDQLMRRAAEERVTGPDLEQSLSKQTKI